MNMRMRRRRLNFSSEFVALNVPEHIASVFQGLSPSEIGALLAPFLKQAIKQAKQGRCMSLTEKKASKCA